MTIENANSHPYKVAIISDADTYANTHPFKVSIIEGGTELVTELPEEGKKGATYILVDDAENPTKAYGIYIYDNGWVLIAQPVDQAVQLVEELPEEGQEGVLYYVPKTGQGDAYDLYRWINNEWIKVDTDVVLYNIEGDHTDGAMTQAATTALKGKFKTLTTADYDYPDNDPDGVAVWRLPLGFYLSPKGIKRYELSTNTGTTAGPVTFLVDTEMVGGYSSILYFGGGLNLTVAREIDGTEVFRTSAVWASSIVDNLDSSATTQPLSANQGKVLKGMIDNNVGMARVLTSDDYNWNSTSSSATEPYDSIALWLLPSGQYQINDYSMKVFTSKVATGLSSPNQHMYLVNKEPSANASILVTPYSANAANDKIKLYVTAVANGQPSGGTTVDGMTIPWGNIPTVVQTTGTSTTNVMSQKAVTDTIYDDFGQGINIKATTGWDDTIGYIALGKGVYLSDNFGEISIGNFSQATGRNGSTSLGYRAKNEFEGISLGAYSVGSTNISIDGDYGTLSVGRKTSETYTDEFGNTVTIPAFTRRIVNVKDPVDDSDVATKHYVDSRNHLYCSYIPTSAGDEVALYYDEAMTSLVSSSEFSNLLFSGIPITITDASSGSTVITYDGNGDAWWGLTGSILVEVTSASTAGKTMRIGRYEDLGGNVLTTLSYGSSTWNDFINAYNAGKIVYCRASSNANPATGAQTRMAFMAYVSNPTNPTSVEFQYVRSVSSKSSSAQCDQVFVYKLTNASGGTWTVETRDMASTIAAGTNAELTYSGTTATINPRLYTTTGQNTNGGVTQKLFTDTVGNIEQALNIINNGGES